MMDDPSGSPLKPFLLLVHHIFSEIAVYLIVKLEGIFVVIHLVQGLQGAPDVFVLQLPDRLTQIPQIGLRRLVGE